MKMTLQQRIDLCREIAPPKSKELKTWEENLAEVIYSSARLAGSKLSRKDNGIVLGRNAIPRFNDYWRSKLDDSKKNSYLKKAYKKLHSYIIEKEYDISSVRVIVLWRILTNYSVDDMLLKDPYLNETKGYISNINKRRNKLKSILGKDGEFEAAEIYDFSFDVLYNFWHKFPYVKGSLRLSIMIMHWIQVENNLWALPMDCSADDLLSALAVDYCGSNSPAKFRNMMRGMLDKYLKGLILEAKGEGKKIPTSKERILSLIRKNNRYSATAMAEILGMSPQGVRKQIAILKKEERLTRIGPDKGGTWKIIEDRILYTHMFPGEG